MKDQLVSLLAAATAQPWAISRPHFDRILASVLSSGRAEQIPTAAELAGKIEPVELEPMALTRPGPKSGRVVRLPIRGILAGHDELFAWWMGGVTTDRVAQAVAAAAADETIGTIILEIDSPGGLVTGLPELAAVIRQARETKNVVAIANDLAASAAYWLASQADEIVATPEALVGSIGVYLLHLDVSAYLEAQGIKATYIQAGKYKTEGASEIPLTQEAIDYAQTLVDSWYSQFVAAVAAGRGVPSGTVRNEYGQGRVLTAADAKKAGMIDRVELPAEMLSRVSGKKSTASAQLVDALGLDPATHTAELDTTPLVDVDPVEHEMGDVVTGVVGDPSLPATPLATVAAAPRSQLDVRVEMRHARKTGTQAPDRAE